MAIRFTKYVQVNRHVTLSLDEKTMIEDFALVSELMELPDLDTWDGLCQVCGEQIVEGKPFFHWMQEPFSLFQHLACFLEACEESLRLGLGLDKGVSRDYATAVALVRTSRTEPWALDEWNRYQWNKEFWSA